MLLAFTTRRMVGSAHLALSPTRFTVQLDFALSDRYSYEKIHTALLGKARLADLGNCHHIKPSNKGSGLMTFAEMYTHLIHIYNSFNGKSLFNMISPADYYTCSQ